ncbi:MAG TPA: hypothetical protein VGW78_06410 [Candidatus Babeliales bacterium]|jgi:hypothetical protein|nr:hypothetical protein [Candidatus Babeliales bacterium]
MYIYAIAIQVILLIGIVFNVNAVLDQPLKEPGLYALSNKDYVLRKLDDGKYYIAHNGEVKNEHKQINGMLDLTNCLGCFSAACYTGWKLVTGSWQEVGCGLISLLAGAGSTSFVSKDFPVDQYNKYQKAISEIGGFGIVLSVIAGLIALSNKDEKTKENSTKTSTS